MMMGDTYNGNESLKFHSNLNYGGTQPMVFAGSDFNMSEQEFMQANGGASRKFKLKHKTLVP